MFARERDENWTREVFVIADKVENEVPTVYMIKDLAGEEVKGTYYRDELQRVRFDPEGVFSIEKVIQTRRRRGIEESLVKWMGWPNKFNQWIPSSNIN